MKATIRKTIQLLFIALVLASCSKSGDEPTPTEIQTDVYVIGHKNVAGRGNTGKIWKNGTLLYTLPEAEVFGIYVSGEDVYVAGSVYNDRRVAMLWKNGSPQELTDGSGDAGATSAYVAGTDVYVAGFESYSSGNSVAKLWKNGIAQDLTNSNFYSEANSVFVSGGDAYVAGWEYNNEVSSAKVWKNGEVLYDLPTLGEAVRPTGVFVVQTEK